MTDTNPNDPRALTAMSILDMNLGRIAGRALGVIIGATLVALVLAEVAGDFFGAVADLNGELQNVTLNSSAAENIAGVMPLILGVLAVFLIVGIFAGFMQRRDGGF